MIIREKMKKMYEMNRLKALQGDADAQLIVADYYYFDYGDLKNRAEAAQWYEKALKNGCTNLNVYLGLARCYEEGLGFEKDLQQAYAYYVKYNIEKLTELIDVNIGLQKNISAGTDQLSGDALKMYNLFQDKTEESFETLLKNTVELSEFYKVRIAAEKGDLSKKYELGNIYWNGLYNVPEDKHKGFEFFMEAALGDHAEAQCMVGYIYENSFGVVTPLPDEAAKWYSKAAEQGNAEAQIRLAHCYEMGKGVDRNDEKAVELIQKAAEQGDAQGQVALAYRYLSGIGVDEDYLKGMELINKAAEQNCHEAIEYLMSIF